MELEDMKRQWETLTAKVEFLDSQLNTTKLNKMKTSQEDLVARYRRFCTIAAVFVIVGPCCIRHFLDNWYLLIALAVFFLICAIMDFVLQRKVGQISIETMPVAEVCQRALRCRRLHHIFMLCLIPLDICLLGLLAYMVKEEEFVLIGMAVGGAIGLCIALREYFKIMDNYKSLIRND